jgi:hypothetical protein
MKAFHEAVLDELLEQRVVSSRGRRNPRGVKRKMSKYRIRRKTPVRTLWINLSKAIRILK